VISLFQETGAVYSDNQLNLLQDLTQIMNTATDVGRILDKALADYTGLDLSEHNERGYSI